MLLYSQIKTDVFNSEIIKVHGVKHEVVGVSPTKHGIKDVDKCRDFIQSSLLMGLYK